MNRLTKTISALFHKFSLFHSVYKGLIITTLLASTLLVWNYTMPSAFQAAWLSKDQMAMLHFKNREFKQAAALFESSDWKAYSVYFSGDFATAQSLFENVSDKQAALASANAYAHSGQFEKAQTLYQALMQEDELSVAANSNYRVVVSAIEKVKSAPPEKSANKKIDDRQIVSEEQPKKAETQVIMSDQVWLEQVRQNPSKFLRQKFQYEYSNKAQ